MLISTNARLFSSRIHDHSNPYYPVKTVTVALTMLAVEADTNARSPAIIVESQFSLAPNANRLQVDSTSWHRAMNLSSSINSHIQFSRNATLSGVGAER